MEEKEAGLEIPDDYSWDLEKIYRNKLMPFLNDLDKDFFTTVGRFDNPLIRCGLLTILQGVRMLVRNNPECRKKLDQAFETKKDK